MDEIDWSYDAWKSGEPYDWSHAARGTNPWDATDFHVDLGCGTLKKGRIGIDRYAAPGVNIVMDLDRLRVLALPREPNGDAVDHSYHEDGFERGGLPFADSSIKSIISHHALEHIGEGFLPLVDDIYRVLEPGGVFYSITPLFPSRTAVEDPDHCRYFMAGTWDAFCGTPGNCWLSSFSVPYTTARFQMLNKDMTPPVTRDQEWGPEDAREIRVLLKAIK